MGEAFWPAVLPALAGSGCLALLVERLLEPPPLACWRRPAAALAIHLGLWLWLSSVLLLLLQRPVFAASSLLAGFLFVVLVSNAKVHSLREPFIFQDFEYFSDALRHPRLYMPFLGAVRALLSLLALGLAIAGGLTIEDSLLDRMSVAEFLSGAATLALVGLLLLWFGARHRLGVTLDPTTDLRQLGLLTALWRYGEEEHAPCDVRSTYEGPGPLPEPGAGLTTLVVVQSESFFDARRLFSGIRGELLGEFDSLRCSAACHGPLQVAAWGANTVRTEFAFLSGLAADSLGVHRFNPYRRVARQGVATIATFLKRLGYRTICVHPYAASFYSRQVVFPRLGFDEFIDIGSFAGAARDGPYIGDLAVAEHVAALLATTAGEPLFVFVITMENHGPLHLEKVAPGDEERLYTESPPPGCEDLTIYLRHLVNADRMAGRLRAAIDRLPGPACLCWFGDHVPIMPGPYRVLGVPDGRTDYLIWRKGDPPRVVVPRELRIDELGRQVLQQMGLLPARE
ncbi:MAG: LTA synthase family protein [Accumulibacter sp.]|uniref:LTA synthase family protein n=1 Tax=Accumulibacter sp. TaxID=2053492 RepID=UPI002FC36863